MGVLTRNKEADARQVTMPAPQSKTGRFANLRARLGRPSEQNEVKALHSTMSGFSHDQCTTCFEYLLSKISTRLVRIFDFKSKQTACRKALGL